MARNGSKFALFSSVFQAARSLCKLCGKLAFWAPRKRSILAALRSSTGSYPQDVKTVDKLEIIPVHVENFPAFFGIKCIGIFFPQAGKFLHFMEYNL